LVLEIDPETLFAGFPIPRGVTVVERRRQELRLYAEGRSQLEIAELLGIPRSLVALDLQLSPGYTPRPSLFTFKPKLGRITATRAARTHRLDAASLCRAIDAGVVRGERHDLGNRVCRTVDLDELVEDLANLPRCAYEGCDERALAPSGACTGPHARALETRGTKRPGETCRRIAEGKRGKPRPDVRERVAAMHADGRAHSEWNVRLLEGRKASPTSSASPASLRRAKFKLAGYKAKSPGRPRGYTETDAANVRQLKADHAKWGYTTIATSAGLTVKQVRAILSG
jgi:hypothetical protein